MASSETVDDVIRRIITILDSVHFPYMLTGSFASSLHGMPRATQDIDLVIAPNLETLDALLKHFPQDRYYVSREACKMVSHVRWCQTFNYLSFVYCSRRDNADCVARKPRVHFPGALYHVISRGNQRQTIFRADADRRRYLELLNHYRVRYRFQLRAYVLMTNHVHLLLEVEKHPLAKIMQGLQQSYTLYFNRKYKLVGHLFQGRYKDILCDRDSYLLELVRYIHLNPVRSKMVTDPADYAWSSHRDYLNSGTTKGAAMVQSEWILNQFAPTLAGARRKYEEFVLGGIGAGHRDDFYDVKEQRFLGDDQFVEGINRSLDLELPRTNRVELSAIETAVSRWHKYPVALLHSRTKEHRGSFARAVVGYLGQELGAVRLNEVAARYGRDQVSLSLGVKRLRERLAQESELSENIESLLRQLRGGKVN